MNVFKIKQLLNLHSTHDSALRLSLLSICRILSLAYIVKGKIILNFIHFSESFYYLTGGTVAILSNMPIGFMMNSYLNLYCRFNQFCDCFYDIHRLLIVHLLVTFTFKQILLH